MSKSSDSAPHPRDSLQEGQPGIRSLLPQGATPQAPEDERPPVGAPSRRPCMGVRERSNNAQDMEDHRVTTDTIQVVKELHAEGLTNVGTVLQGRLFRSLADIGDLEQELGPAADYRICKGIYLEPEDISFAGYQDIVDATNSCIDRMLDAGAYVAIASHDYPVIDHAKSALESFGMGPGKEDPRPNAGENRRNKGPGYEFQMLLGVRGPLRRKLAAEGHRTRIYLPYGEKWYEYSIRRLKENPTIGTQVAKAFLMPWTNRP